MPKIVFMLLLCLLLAGCEAVGRGIAAELLDESRSVEKSGFDCVATMYKVFEVVAVYRFQSEVMAYDDDIAVGAIRLGHPYYAVEGTPYGVFGVGLDVYATVASPPPSVRGDDFSSRQGKGVFRVRNVLQR